VLQYKQRCKGLGPYMLAIARQIISRAFDCLTCPAKAYQVEVGNSERVGGLWPVSLAVFSFSELSRFKISTLKGVLSSAMIHLKDT
jgi:hypothetical protein